jgi:hypothetical protein
MNTKQLQEIINSEVEKGKLPLAWYNSEILLKNNVSESSSFLSKVYLQKRSPRGNSEFLISKIYEIL